VTFDSPVTTPLLKVTQTHSTHTLYFCVYVVRLFLTLLPVAVEAVRRYRQPSHYISCFRPDFLKVIQFVAELVHNKCQRIVFDCSSPNGILLFREASRLLVTYGQRILTGAPATYKDKYKGVSICLLILSRALSGGYCNLGVFQVIYIYIYIYIYIE
jgi:hypothetical protein